MKLHHRKAELGSHRSVDACVLIYLSIPLYAHSTSHLPTICCPTSPPKNSKSTHNNNAVIVITMAKSENPLDVYRRQQRKKELKKNKNARIKARDAKVAATRGIGEVQAEISLLERKRDRFGKSRGGKEGGDDEAAASERTPGGLDANETKKLERLRKELKIVTAESVKRKELHELAEREKEKQFIAAQKTVEGVQKLNESKYSVLERYASVYYDEQMNPYGAPPPCKPKMYWSDSEKKTTTMNPRMAVVPKQLQQKFDTEMKKHGINNDSDVGSNNHDVSSRKRRWDEQGPNVHLHNQQQFNNQTTQGQYQHHSPPPPPPPPPHRPFKNQCQCLLHRPFKSQCQCLLHRLLLYHRLSLHTKRQCHHLITANLLKCQNHQKQ